MKKIDVIGHIHMKASSLPSKATKALAHLGVTVSGVKDKSMDTSCLQNRQSSHLFIKAKISCMENNLDAWSTDLRINLIIDNLQWWVGHNYAKIYKKSQFAPHLTSRCLKEDYYGTWTVISF